MKNRSNKNANLNMPRLAPGNFKYVIFYNLVTKTISLLVRGTIIRDQKGMIIIWKLYIETSNL